VIWISTVFSYFLYGFHDGNLGLLWGPLLGLFIVVVIYCRWWLVHDTRWYTYAQTCWQGSLVLSVVQLVLIVHNVMTIAAILPMLVSLGALVTGWVLMFYQPRPRVQPW
jgi:hypothetical protein